MPGRRFPLSLICMFLLAGLPLLVFGAAPCRAEPSSNPQIALILGGGGARGAAHVGVLKVLQREGISPDMIIGSSTGALLGGMYSAGVPIEKIEELVLDGSFKRAFFPMPIFVKTTINMLKAPISLWKDNNFPGVYSGDSIAAMVNKNVPRDRRIIENLPIRFFAVATDVISGKPKEISDGDLGRAIQASCTFAPLYKPIYLGDRLYVDGGLTANLPVEWARQEGAQIIIVVNVDEELCESEARSIKSLKGFLSRMSTIIVTTMDDAQFKAQNGEVVVKPDVTGIMLLAKDKKSIRKALDAGEQAAIKCLPQIKEQISSVKLSLKEAKQD